MMCDPAAGRCRGNNTKGKTQRKKRKREPQARMQQKRGRRKKKQAHCKKKAWGIKGRKREAAQNSRCEWNEKLASAMGKARPRPPLGEDCSTSKKQGNRNTSKKAGIKYLQRKGKIWVKKKKGRLGQGEGIAAVARGKIKRWSRNQLVSRRRRRGGAGEKRGGKKKDCKESTRATPAKRSTECGRDKLSGKPNDASQGGGRQKKKTRRGGKKQGLSEKKSQNGRAAKHTFRAKSFVSGRKRAVYHVRKKRRPQEKRKIHQGRRAKSNCGKKRKNKGQKTTERKM